MPRGQRKTDEERIKSIDDQLQEMESRRDSIQAKIDDLQSQKQDILNEIRNRKLEEIANLLDSTGKTAEEAIEILKQA